MQPIIVIGAGLAGYTVARELRKLDKTASLIIITADDGGFYSKPMLSNAFAQKKQPAQLITQTAQQMGAQLTATILTGTRVLGIDTANKAVETSAGRFEYSKLVIAAGAQPIRLSLQGDAASEVQSVNHVSDYARFRAQLDALVADGAGAPPRIAILGAGLIGCEFADDLSNAGHAVTLIDPNPMPLAALAAPELSQGLREALLERGVTLRLGTTATSVDRTPSGLRIALADGTDFETDLVLSAVGLRPDISLAQAAGLATSRGIVVDTSGRTSAADVFALGDCAEYTVAPGNTRILPYIAPLMSAARAIARVLAGEAAEIDHKPAPVIVKTPSYPLALLPPQAGIGGYWLAETEAARTICRYYDEAHVMIGFGISHHEAALRQNLLSAMGTTKAEKADQAA